MRQMGAARRDNQLSLGSAIIPTRSLRKKPSKGRARVLKTCRSRPLLRSKRPPAGSGRRRRRQILVAPPPHPPTTQNKPPSPQKQEPQQKHL